MRNNYGLILIALIWVLSSCKKEISVSVKIKDKVTSNGIANTHVWIVEETNASVGGSGVYNDFFEGYTDSNGELVITERFNTNYSYRIYANPPNSSEGYCFFNEISQHLFLGGNFENQEVVFEYAHCASISLDIHNINCFNTDDSIYYNGVWLNGDRSFSNYQLGCINITTGFVDVPYGDYRYEWNATKNGVTTFYDTTFFLNPGDSVTVTMNY
ncbi:MAG: hypothetical protein R2799_09305 [Crocinitomicaceae bacterium]